MIAQWLKQWLEKFRAWLRPAPPAPLVEEREAPLDEATRWRRFLEELARERIAPDYRELADLLWLEQWMARRAPSDDAGARDIGIEDRRQAAPPRPEPDGAGAAGAGGGQAAVKAFAAAGAQSLESRTPAVRVRLQGAPALPGGAEITRALRPLSRRAKSIQPRLFDEEATAEASAECGFLRPVFRAAPERWFSVALVVEQSPAMVVWQGAARELFNLLRAHNAFREVRRCELRIQGAEAVLSERGIERSHRALQSAHDRLLVILLTDGASPAWAGETMARVLTDWAATSSVVIAQALGQRLWPRTPLGWPEVEVKSVAPGAANRALQPVGGWAGWGAEPLTAVPVVGLNADTIGPWARMLMRPGAVSRAALFAAPTGEAGLLAAPPEPARDFDSAEDRVNHFRALVSPETYRLAIYLSLLPLTLPVMRLVQTAMLAHPRQDQLAELLLGGIVHRISGDDAATPEDEIEYDFHDGVRELLETRLYVDEINDLLAAIGEHIGRRESGGFSFAALLPHDAGEESLPPGAKPFARFLVPALRRLGLEHMLGETLTQPATGQAAVSLEPFEFVTVTLDERGREINRRTLRKRRFLEDLGDGVTLAMVEVPGGEFLRGTGEHDVAREKKEIERHFKGRGNWVDAERPQRKVTVPPFYIGQFTVTQRQWRIVAGWEKVNQDLDPDPSNFKGDDRPVECVSWDDAREFCARLSARTGGAYRLPAEAEWEYACRAGTTTPFAFGETITPEIVNYDGEYPYAKAEKGVNRGETIPVGNLGVANAFGIYDMHGNVWEWCEDDWHDSYESAPLDGHAWVDAPSRGSLRVYRGGGWSAYAVNCRSALRYYVTPGYRYGGYLGFRLLRTYR